MFLLWEGQDDVGKDRKMHTDTKEKYLHNKGYPLKIIWEHKFKSKQRSNPKLKEFVRQCHPSFVTPESSTKTGELLCSSTSEIITWRIHPAASYLVAWKQQQQQQQQKQKDSVTK